MNGFLSTTMLSDVADMHSSVGTNIGDGYESVRFVLTIDTIRQLYAYVASFSAIPAEAEVLFSLGTIWHINSTESKKQFYQIELVPYNELDSQLDTLIERYTTYGCNLSSVGDILRELENYEEAEWFYKKMLEQHHLSNETRVHLYYNMGMLQKELGRNGKALECF